MIVLGLDPGLAAFGWAVISGQPGELPIWTSTTIVAWGTIRTERVFEQRWHDIRLRWERIAQQLSAVADQHHPQLVSTEVYQSYGLARSGGLVVAKITGACMEWSRGHDLALMEFTASQIKRECRRLLAVEPDLRLDAKQEVQAALYERFGQKLARDAADACAAAIVALGGCCF